MVLSLSEYGDIIYEGTYQCNLSKLSNFFYRGLRICDKSKNSVSKSILCNVCNISRLR